MPKFLHRSILLVLFLLPFCRTLSAQDLSVALTSGYTIPNLPKWQYIAGFSNGFDVALSWTADDSQRWHTFRDNPTFGLRANYAQIPNGIAGNKLGVAGFMQNPILTIHRHQLLWELDLGLSLFTNPYRRSLDPDNRFIGSYLNCLIHAGFAYRYATPRGAVSIAEKLVHSSNGYLYKPNFGLNFLQTELAYHFSSGKHYPLRGLGTDTLSSDYLYLSYSPGMAQPRWRTVGNHFYYCHTASIGYMWHTTPTLAWGCGLDLSYNYSQKAISDFHLDNYTLPFYLGNTLNLETYWGRLSVRAALGAYLLRSKLTAVISLPFYERVGAYYHFPNGLFTGISMRAYAAHIDFIEWNVGVKIPNPKPIT